jgi:hypothetical protein
MQQQQKRITPMVAFCLPTVLPVLMELRLPNQRRMLKVMWRAIGIACSVYVVTGVFAYLTFGSQLEDSNGNFLENDYHNDPAVLVGMVAMSLAVCFAIPLLVHAFRTNMFNLLYPGLNAAQDMSSVFRVGVTVVMMSLCLVVAVTVSDISRICTVLGATSNPLICFALPSAFFIKGGFRFGFVIFMYVCVYVCMYVCMHVCKSGGCGYSFILGLYWMFNICLSSVLCYF